MGTTATLKQSMWARVHIQFSAWSPADSVSGYFSTLITAPPTGPNTRKTYFRAPGTITMVDLYTYTTGGASTGEAWSLYIRINDATDYLISTLSLATQERIFSNSSLNIPIVAGDFFEMKFVNPAWTTNPVNIIGSGGIYIQTN